VTETPAQARIVERMMTRRIRYQVEEHQHRIGYLIANTLDHVERALHDSLSLAAL
jgi:hypothetical protein